MEIDLLWIKAFAQFAFALSLDSDHWTRHQTYCHRLFFDGRKIFYIQRKEWMQKTTVPESHWSRWRDHADFKQLVSRRGICWQDCLKNPAGSKCVWEQPTRSHSNSSVCHSPPATGTSLKIRISSNSHLIYIILLKWMWRNDFILLHISRTLYLELQKFSLKVISSKTKRAQTHGFLMRVISRLPVFCLYE